MIAVLYSVAPDDVPMALGGLGAGAVVLLGLGLAFKSPLLLRGAIMAAFGFVTLGISSL